MTTDIRIGIKDDTASGLKSIEQKLGDASKTTNKLDDSLRNVNDDVADMLSEFDDLGDRIKQLGHEVQNADNKLDNFGKTGDKATSSVKANVLGSLVSFELLKKGVQLATKSIVELAENGNTGAKELTNSFNKFKETLLAIGNDKGLDRYFSSLSSLLNSTSETLENNSGILERSQNKLAEWITSTGEYFGIIEEGSTKALEGVRETEKELDIARKKALEFAKQEEEAKKQQEELTKSLEALERQQSEAFLLSKYEQIKTYEVANDLIEEEKERLAELASQGKLTTEELATGQARLNALVARRVQIEADKQAAIDKYLASQQNAVKEEIKLEITKAEKIVDIEKQKQAELRKIRSDALKDPATDAAKQIVGSISQRDITESIAQKRADEISFRFQQQREKLQSDNAARIRTEEARKAEIKAMEDSKDKENAEARLRNDIREREQQYRSDIGKVSGQERSAIRESRQRTFQQARRGELSPEDIAGATKDLATEAVNNASAQGQLNSSTADALRQQVKVLTDNTQEILQNTQDIEDIKQLLNSLPSGSRRRAQRGGLN